MIVNVLVTALLEHVTVLWTVNKYFCDWFTDDVGKPQKGLLCIDTSNNLLKTMRKFSPPRVP